MLLKRRIELLGLGVMAGLGLSALVNDAPPERPPHAHPGHAAPVPSQPAAGGRGREADSPLEIPARGWWQIAKRVAHGISEDRVLAEAASVTFYGLLAIFPALAALVSVYGLFADPHSIETQMNAMSGVVPGGGMQIISQQLHALVNSSGTALGVGLFVGLATSLWSANSGIKALFDALNAVYEEHETRSFLRLTAISLCFTVGIILFLVLALAAVVVLPAVLDFAGGAHALAWLRWPIILVVVALFLALLYRFGPSRAKARWQWVSWGSAFAAIAWLIVSLAFSWYVANFGSYNKTYGSLGAAVGFMTWIWLSVAVVLIGAELNAEMEHQTARDTTTGTPRPMGARGATKADTVAA